MYEKFNPNFQNATMAQDLNGINPYQDQYFGEYDTTPYVEALHPVLPGALPSSGPMANSPYPLQASLATPTLSPPVTPGTAGNYAKGGEIKEKKRRKKAEEHVNPYPSLAELIREQGENGDTILAHINPIEAMILKELGGSGTINPITGLPEFFPWLIPALIGGALLAHKKTRRVALPLMGSVVGNMMLPGVGGMLGGALGGATSGALDKRSIGREALYGGLGGALLPSATSLLGSGASALGATGVGSALSNYGTQNAILPALGLGNLGGGGGGGFLASSLGGRTMAANSGKLGQRGTKAVAAGDEEKPSFMNMLGSKSKDFFSSPENLLALGLVGSQIAGQQTPRKAGLARAKEDRAYAQAMKGTPEERLAEARLVRDIEQQKFLPRELLGNLAPLAMYRKEHTPEEQRKSGKWFSYYDNPALQGGPIPYKKGGAVEYIHEEYEVPRGGNHGLSHFLQGMTGGQDDKIPAMLSDGEYVIDASTVADLGDGNNEAGANKLDGMVKNIRKHKGGSTKLPPKAKSIKTYMRRKK